MRCKICGVCVKSGITKDAHCWVKSQQCVKCHYLGDKTFRGSYKYTDEDKLKRGIKI